MANEKKNIVSNTYKGLVFTTFSLLVILIAKNLIFSYKLYSYEVTDHQFENNELFEKDSLPFEGNRNFNSNKADSNIVTAETTKQKNKISFLRKPVMVNSISLIPTCGSKKLL